MGLSLKSKRRTKASSTLTLSGLADVVADELLVQTRAFLEEASDALFAREAGIAIVEQAFPFEEGKAILGLR